MMGAGLRLISWFFHSRKDDKEEWIYRFETGTSRACRTALKAAQPAVCQTSGGARVTSPQSPILR